MSHSAARVKAEKAAGNAGCGSEAYPSFQS
jgi:hypothetical protein